MAQSALTVTPPNPTPPTNLVSSGSTPPNPGTFDPTIYTNAGGDLHYPRPELAPFYDDGYVFPEPNGKVFAAAKAALLVGGTTQENEGKTTETSSVWGTNFGGNAAVYNPAGPLTMVGAGPAMSVPIAGPISPNNSHASTLSGSAVPTVSGATGASNVSGVGTTLLTVTGTNFNRASVVNISGVPQPTNYVSATSLTVANAMKRTTAGTLPVTVTSNGVTTASVNWTLT